MKHTTTEPSYSRRQGRGKAHTEANTLGTYRASFFLHLLQMNSCFSLKRGSVISLSDATAIVWLVPHLAHLTLWISSFTVGRLPIAIQKRWHKSKARQSLALVYASLNPRKPLVSPMKANRCRVLKNSLVASSLPSSASNMVSQSLTAEGSSRTSLGYIPRTLVINSC